MFDLYLEKTVMKKTGPYRRSLIRVYNIHIHDVLPFTYMWKHGGDEKQDFNLSVYEGGENGK